MNNLYLNDPRLTAYVLGELELDEAAEIESRLGSDASLREAVAELRSTIDIVQAEFDAEPALALTPEQRTTVQQPPPETAARSLNSPLIFRSRALWMGISLAAAACLALVVFMPESVDTNPAGQYALEKPAPSSLGRERAEAASGPLGQPADRDEIASLRSRQDLTLKDTARHQLGVESDMAQRAGEVSLHAERRAENWVGHIDAAAGAGGAGGGRGAVDQAPRPESAAGPTAHDAFRVPPSVVPSGGDGGLSGPKSPQTDAETAVDDKVWREGDRKFDFNGDKNEEYQRLVDNPFFRPTEEPFSTFSIDVDTASYSIIRRHLEQGVLPPPDAVRIEEMVNSFDYAYEPPSGDVPFSANIEINAAPWQPAHRLVRIGLKGKEVKLDMRPATSLVFLIDVSGSMQAKDKLPLVKQSLRLLVDQLNGDDRLGIVTYAGNAGVALPSMYVNDENRERIVTAIDSLSAGGSTNGAGGITVAYNLAAEHFIKDGVNRVILCTDGDFNVGVSSEADLVRLIEEKRQTGVFLSVLGFGEGNLKEAKMQQLAQNGNGNFAYIDSIDEGRRVLVEQMGGTLVTIAKDVKLQVEFNPTKVAAYRLLGYENRMLADQDFNDDRKDAGEIGAGHTVTALYEVVPAGAEMVAGLPAEIAPPADEPKYQKPASQPVPSDELLTLKIRYKAPEGDASNLLEYSATDAGAELDSASDDFKFAAAVAAFGMVLRESPHRAAATFESVLALAPPATKSGTSGRAAVELEDRRALRKIAGAADSRLDEQAARKADYRAQFLRLVERAAEIAKQQRAAE